MKRLMDIGISALALIILAPLIAIIAIAVRVTMGPPVLFRQRRPGLHGRPFTLVKFRTMAARRTAEGQLLPDGERLTRLGRFLRSTSLDELPQLINVLRGEMSLVGPRPLLVQYLARYNDEQMRRHEVRPGVTGWAQVNGRNALSWEEKFKLDVWYVDHRSLILDLKILGMTVRKIARREGISDGENATMAEFMGTTQAQESNA
jgi:sugar transferase EpsL